MNLNLVFRILSFILLPIAIIIGVVDTLAITMAIANPQMLLPVFVLAAVVMYVLSSIRFHRNAVLEGKTFSKKTKDFIKVNAYVTLGFSILSLVQGVTVLISKKAMKEVIESYSQISVANHISSGSAQSIIYVSLSFSIAISFIIIAHILLSFKFLKQNENKFID